ncbi:ABC-three component system protein [Gimesia panareensis]|uniref:ABC-three component system protein n=1 Tax=Gimesia panareensis TaxID=2527978 RepID=UPI00118CEF42|nr:ABC-three component system protein [Gimesia panareensis]QDU48441.1 hypothetical protein Pan110_07550 [Gimesia panareensis]
MDRAQKAYFKLASREKYGRLKRQGFEDWFCEIMQLAYPTDFEAVRLAQGDGGMDGFRLSTSGVYQVYAPREQKTSEIVSKITKDILTAKDYLLERNVEMKSWTFVHNDSDGLAPDVMAKLGEVKQLYTDVFIDRWGFEMIWQTLKTLELDQLEELFGESPTEANIENLEIPEIIEIIARLQRTNPNPIPRFSFPDPAKLAHNRLSDESADWLQLGERKESLVEACIKTNQDPTVGEKIAEAFRVKYQELRSSNLESDMIFQILWEFAGGEELTSRQQQAAIAAVMAYFFHKCDIFENVPESK